MRRVMILFAAALLLAVAACNTAKSNGGASSAPPAASPASPSPAASASSSASPSASPEETGQPLKAAHIEFRVPGAWTVQNGEESFTFQQDGTPVGGLDGLGWSDTLEGLLPNGAVVESQSELAGLPVKTVEAKLNLEGQGDEAREELHYYFFLSDEKAVYDLHFDAKQVRDDEARNIAQTAVIPK